MTISQKKYITTQAILSFLINGIVNGIIAYYLNRGKQTDPLPISQQYIDLFVDIAITSLLLAWLIAWSINSGLKKAQVYGVTTPTTKLQAWMGRRFRMPAIYGWTLCIGMIPLLYGLTILGIQLFDVTQITLWGYIIYKSSYTAIAGTAFAIIFMISGFYVQVESKSSPSLTQ
jgi:hypothetical protein